MFKFKLRPVALLVMFVMLLSNFGCSLGVEDNNTENKSATNILSSENLDSSLLNSNTNSGNSSEIFVDGALGNDSNSGFSGTPKKTLKAGLDAVSPGGVVNVADGTYSDNNLTFTKSVILHGNDMNKVIIQNSNFNVVSNDKVSIVQMTFKGNNGEKGGAINNNGSLYIGECTFKENHANSGGAIYNLKTLNMYRCVFEGNLADKSADSTGGAIHSQSGNITMDDCTFKENKANGDGGVINNNGKSTLKMTHSCFINNHASSAGAVYSVSNCTLTDVYFDGNTASNMAGSLFSWGSLIVENSQFYNSKADSEAGAILLTSSCTSSFTGCNINNNHALTNGAISNYGKCTLNNNKFSSNTADNNGGAVSSLGKDSSLTAKNNVFNKNLAKSSFGGAIYTTGSSDIQMNNFTENTASKGGSVANSGVCTVSNNQFTNNHGTTGGAFYNDFKGVLTSQPFAAVTSNLFENNTAEKSGGALTNLGNVELRSNKFFRNSIKLDNGAGGAICNSNGVCKIYEGNNFFHNSMNCLGGGVSNIDDACMYISGAGNNFVDTNLYNTGYMDLKDCTIYKNTEDGRYLENRGKSFSKSNTVQILSSDHSFPTVKHSDFWFQFPTHFGVAEAMGDHVVKQGDSITVSTVLYKSIGAFGVRWWDESLTKWPVKICLYNENGCIDTKTMLTYKRGSNEFGPSMPFGTLFATYDTSKMAPGEYIIQVSTDSGSWNYDSSVQYWRLLVVPK